MLLPAFTTLTTLPPAAQVALFLVTQLLAPWAEAGPHRHRLQTTDRGVGGGTAGPSMRPPTPPSALAPAPPRPVAKEECVVGVVGGVDMVVCPTLEATSPVQGVSSLMLVSEITGMQSLVLAVLQESVARAEREVW